MDAFTFQMAAENVRGNTQEAAAIVWAENALGSQYMFRVPSNGTSYIIPVPENLPTTTSARWLTDVVALNPSCAWQETNISSTLQIGSNTTSNSTSFLSNDVYVNIPAISADIKLPWSSICEFYRDFTLLIWCYSYLSEISPLRSWDNAN